ncbi:MAG: hypothetical protein ACYCOU_21810 [Sulfobacillus sp.]
MPTDVHKQYIIAARYYYGDDTVSMGIAWLRDDCDPPEWNVIDGVRVLAWLDGVPEYCDGAQPEAEEPDAYLVHYREVSVGGSIKRVTCVSLEREAPLILNNMLVASREVLKVEPLYRRGEA